MKKLLLTLIVSLAFCGSIFAQYESHWPDFRYTAFDNQEPVVAAIMINGEIITAEYDGWDALEIAFFVGDECRGAGAEFGDYDPVTNYLYNGYVEEWGDPYPTIDGAPLYYNTPNEEVTVKMYDHLRGILYEECVVTLMGEPYTITTGIPHDQGWDDPENPIFLNFIGEEPVTQTFTKHIDAYEGNGGYYLIASPINEETEPSVENGFLTDTYDLYYFDQAEPDEWRNYEANTFNIVNGKGYLYASATETDLTFTGTAYNGDGVIELVYTFGNGVDLPGFNLVGNPFTEDAYLDRDYYIMNEEGSEIMSEPAEGALEHMTGCFVVATEEGESVTFSTSEKAKGSLVTLNLSNNRGIIDRAIVRFGQGRQLPKFQINRNSTKLYIPVDNADYAVVCSEAQGEMPVSFKAEKNGVYTLSINAENVEFGYLHLIDNMTGNDVDLLSTPSYSFEASATDYASRFKLVFATGNAENDFAFFSNGSFVINNEGNATLQVVDVTGRMISSETINGCANVNVNAAPGVYMLRLVNGDNVKVQKVVVK